MSTKTAGAIVVGVTGRGREPAALRFAADLARREGAEVVLVHAFDTGPPAAPPGVLITYAEAADVARTVVEDVADELLQLTGGTVTPRTLVMGGRPGRVLVDVGREARMVVVQHRRDHALTRVFVGSTAYGAAAHAVGPVVSVNPEWQPGHGGEVVVGVHEGAGPRSVLEAGFAWAASTGATLRVVHAWRFDAAYDDVITPRAAQQWRDEEKRVLDAAAADLRERHPEVPVVIEVRHHWPAEVLVDDSQNASMVVVGRHASHPWAAERLGSIARTCLRAAKSPVMVVPVDPAADQEWGLAADEVSPQT
jgi:nucleotide-binding universal stress UspA family protein